MASTDSCDRAVLNVVHHDGASATPAALKGQLAALISDVDAIPGG